jgi:O-antigen chain-terminating methyltransferase
MHVVGDRVTMAESQIRETSDRLTATDERHLRNDTFLKNDLAQQKRLIALFLEEARQRLPEPFSQDQVQTFVDEDQHLVDAFYVAFEEQFRGDRDEVVDRLKVYLPLIEEAKVGTPESLILDIGCGRGEWLWLLREAGYTARGIDTNRVMLEECRARELEVIEANVLAYLRTLPDASVGAVTGFHIIEHLPFPVLLKLLNETMRVLKSKGLAIFETPNPQNILVGSNNFYTDPTHFNPLPSLLTKFLLENAGFVQVEVKNLNPYKDSFKVSGSELAERFNDYFYGPQDYAVIGHKL